MTSQVKEEQGVPKPAGPNLNIIITCPDCRTYPPQLTEEYTSGEMVCTECGLVVCPQIVDTHSEWRTFSNDDLNGADPSRVGGPIDPLLGDQLLTAISFEKGDTRGRDLARAQTRGLSDPKNTILNAGFMRIAHFCDTLGLPKIVQDACKDVFRLCYDDRRLKGRSKESLVAAAIVIGSRLCDLPQSFQEVHVITKVPKKDIGKSFKVMAVVLLEKRGTNPMPDEAVGAAQTTAESLVRRFCLRLGLSPSLASSAETIAHRAQQIGIGGGRSPMTIAAAVILLVVEAAGSDVLVHNISRVTGVSEGTIRTGHRLLMEHEQELVKGLNLKASKTEK